jgi:hypothetical protein
MYGLINWIRSFTYDSNGDIIKSNGQPVFAAHPQPNLWQLIIDTAEDLSNRYDLIQLPPWCNGSGEGYTPFQHRNLNSNWGTMAVLIQAIAAMYKAGMQVSADLPFRQMNGENGGPGVFNYTQYPDSLGNYWDLVPEDFQCFNQPGETIPPFQQQDSVIDPTGNYPFGRVLSMQHSPDGYVNNNFISILGYFIKQLGLLLQYTKFRWDDIKGANGACVLLVMNSQPKAQFYAEADTGNQGELVWIANTVMQGRTALEGYDQYWNTQRACNNYDATQFDKGAPQLWQLYPSLCVLFTNNPDVATTWSPTGGISQQIAFNLLLGIIHDMFLPCACYLVYAEDYYGASPNYPTGRGLQSFIDNALWFGSYFAFGNFKRVWVDKDVYAYYRDGEGGSVGWSGGCLIVINFNTYNARTITVEVPQQWKPGDWIHNYSMTGNDENYNVSPDGLLTVTVKSNYFSGGQSYLLLAPGGVSGKVNRPPLN